MWGRAGVEKVAHVEEMDSSGELGLQGFFSLTASHSKGSQYICESNTELVNVLCSVVAEARMTADVNSRPLSPSPLHKAVNLHFASSTFARHASSHLAVPASPTPSQRPSSPQPTTPGFDSATPKRFRATPKKVTERHPIFVLLLDLPPHMVDVTLEPEKRAVEFVDEARVMEFVEKAVRGWLKEQGFLSRGSERAGRGTMVAAELVTSDDELTPVKRAREGLAQYMSPHGPLSPRPATPVRANNVGPTIVRSARRGPTSVERGDRLDQSTLRPSGDGIVIDTTATEPVRWVDPVSGEVVMIDPRSGNSWRVGERPDEAVRGVSARGCVSPLAKRQARVDRSSLRKRAPEAGEVVAPPPEWMATALSEWANPAFPTAPPAIPALPAVQVDDPDPRSDDDQPPPGLPAWLHKSGVSRARTRQLDAFFRHSTRVDAHRLLGDAAGQRVTKEALARAKFIAQVDRKFLLVAVPLGTKAGTGGERVGCGGEALVMVDQHAADERVRVERIWEGVAGRVGRGEEVEREVWEPSKGVVVSRGEEIQLKAEGKREQLRRWGIDVELATEGQGDDGRSAEGDGHGDYAQVWLRAVPRVVASRLRTEPRLRQELVRSYLGADYAVGSGANGTAPTTAVAALRDCPPVLAELMNNLACRGAIMFNDGQFA